MKTHSASVLENLSASRLAIVVSSKYGEQCRCTLGSFVEANRSELPGNWRQLPTQFARQIKAFGSMPLNLGAHGIFTLRAA